MTRTLALGAMLLAGCSAALTTPAVTMRARLEAACYASDGRPLYQPEVSAAVEYACALRWADYCAVFGCE